MLIIYVNILGSQKEVVLEMFFIYEGLGWIKTYLAFHTRTVAFWFDYHQRVWLLLAKGKIICVRVACYVADVDTVALSFDEHEISAFIDEEGRSVYCDPVTPHVIPSIEQVNLSFFNIDLNMEKHMTTIFLFVLFEFKVVLSILKLSGILIFFRNIQPFL